MRSTRGGVPIKKKKRKGMGVRERTSRVGQGACFSVYLRTERKTYE